MSDEPKHTPTPWRVYEYKSIENQHGLIIANCSMTYSAEANAARIVQCVNEYDGLIETIESIRAEKAELTNKYKSLFEMLDLATYEICDAAKKYGDIDLDSAAYGCIRELKQHPEFEQKSAEIDLVKQVMSERAELIEALRAAWSALKEADRRFSIKTGNALSESITTTLAKFEKP